MKLGNRMPVDLGIVLVAGLTMALAGCTPGAMTLAALSAPAAAASAPAYCMDFTTPNGRITVGEASAPQCVVINAAPVADHSAPVAAASAPQCVGIVTSTVDMRRC
jgi:hypothetical protein